MIIKIQYFKTRYCIKDIFYFIKYIEKIFLLLVIWPSLAFEYYHT